MRAARKAQDKDCKADSAVPSAASGCVVGPLLCQDVPFSANEQCKCADEEESREREPGAETMSAIRGCPARVGRQLSLKSPFKCLVLF